MYMASAHLTKRKTKEDPIPRKENTNLVVFGVTTFKWGGVWQPEEQQSSGNEDSRVNKRRAKMEEKRWSSRFYIFLN